MTDNVNHPAHYAEGWSNGAEVIDITEHLNFNRGNAVKYISRAGKKSALSEVEDLQKAQWYLSREIERLTDRSQAEPAYQVVPDDLWAGIDRSIVEVQEKRERDRTSRPPRVWDSIMDVPPSVEVEDKDGDRWEAESVFEEQTYYRRHPEHLSDGTNFYAPFTEALDIEPEGSK